MSWTLNRRLIGVTCKTVESPVAVSENSILFGFFHNFMACVLHFHSPPKYQLYNNFSIRFPSATGLPNTPPSLFLVLSVKINIQASSSFKISHVSSLLLFLQESQVKQTVKDTISGLGKKFNHHKS